MVILIRIVLLARRVGVLSVLFSLEIFLLGLFLEFLKNFSLFSFGGIGILLRLVVLGSLVSLLLIVRGVSFKGGLNLNLGW